MTHVTASLCYPEQLYHEICVYGNQSATVQHCYSKSNIHGHFRILVVLSHNRATSSYIGNVSVPNKRDLSNPYGEWSEYTETFKSV